MNLIWAALFASLACGQPSPETHDPAPAGSSLVAQGPSGKAPASHAERDDDDVPVEKFKDGAKAFGEVRESILKKYYAEGITEDDVYRAATAGMLEKLEPRMKKYNRLMSPREIAEIKNDMKGEVVGVGVKIDFDEKSGYADVIGTLPGSPSEKAGLLAGDKIVTVNGKLYKGMKIGDVVADIRGKAGDPVTLSVLRGDKLIAFTVVRDRVAYDSAMHMMLPENIGYLRIPSFNDKTPAAVKTSLEDLEKQGAHALVVDLRNCPGGMFDRALDVAEMFVPEGATIVTVKSRGKPEDKHVSKGKPILPTVPVAVLVDNGTASGGEILAASLRENRHAKLVGAKTHGKWSVQALDDLPNGFAYKYTIGLFRTPSGKSYEGVGMSPDVESAMDEGALSRAQAVKPEERLAIDVQLRTAKELVAPK